MISNQDITLWGIDHPWRDADQVEQDLLLSQGMCAIAADPLLSSELILRGGTAFHKLFMPKPFRYSEDLDYVRTSSGAIGDVMKAITKIGNELGYRVRTEMGKYPKVFWRFERASGLPGKIKVEINTYERFSAFAPALVRHEVESGYCNASADIATLRVEELVATKIRALYQRSKGRDLYDLWLALDVLKLDPKAILAAFPVYRPEGMTARLLEANLIAKLDDTGFCSDVDVLRRADSPEYDPQVAGKMILDRLVRKLEF